MLEGLVVNWEGVNYTEFKVNYWLLNAYKNLFQSGFKRTLSMLLSMLFRYSRVKNSDPISFSLSFQPFSQMFVKSSGFIPGMRVLGSSSPKEPPRPLEKINKYQSIILSAAVLPAFSSCKILRTDYGSIPRRLCLFDSRGRFIVPLCGTQKTCLVYSISSKSTLEPTRVQDTLSEGCCDCLTGLWFSLPPAPILAPSLRVCPARLPCLSLISPY